MVGFGKPFVEMRLSPAEYVADRIGIRTARGRTFDSLLTSALGHAGVLIEDFVRRREAGELSDYEKRSYLMASLEQHEDGSDLSFDELKELSQVCLPSVAALIDLLYSAQRFGPFARVFPGYALT